MLADVIWTTIKKILPWTLLLMFISFGVAIIVGGGQIWIQQNGQVGDSYIYRYIINGNTFYEFQIDKYITGLQMEDIFTQWAEIPDKFIQAWENMTYNTDWTNKPWRSLANTLIMIPNMLANVINTIILLPLQLISQLLTVVLRVLGQQINEQSTFWLGKVLYNINNWNGIPMIPYIKM